jgi:TetR/AcrR family transcriptional regulator, regulator of cefoperazone and chloramphenicol sensitivity
MSTQTPVSDSETRQRVLDAAVKLFAERGFKNVTIRDVCREAGANLAAVNYYFRDKLGLYKEVVQLAADAMDRHKQAAMDAGEGQTPEEQLRAYIQSFLHSMLGEEPDERTSLIEKLVGREMGDPSPAFDLIVDKGIKPSAGRLGALVAQLLGCSADDQRVWQTALSIQSQCVFYKLSKPVFARMAPELKFTPDVIDGIANHIAAFSLAGIRALARVSRRDSDLTQMASLGMLAAGSGYQFALKEVRP